jgi:hypothetical protein
LVSLSWSPLKKDPKPTRQHQAIIMLPKKQALFTSNDMIDEKANVTPRFFGEFHTVFANQ